MPPCDPSRRDHPEHPSVSSTWLAEAQRMEPAAWSRLVTTFGGIVYRWCRTSGVSESDAADVVQEVFIGVARGLPHFQRQKEQGSFRAWLATITRNCVRDHFRRVAKRQAAAGGTDAWRRLQQQAAPLESTICSDAVEGSIVQGVLQVVQAEFEPTTWQAFWRTTVEAQSPAEVAAHTGLSLASVYQAKSRVLRRLRQRWAEVPR